jgi:hypothetical protein
MALVCSADLDMPSPENMGKEVPELQAA